MEIFHSFLYVYQRVRLDKPWISLRLFHWSTLKCPEAFITNYRNYRALGGAGSILGQSKAVEHLTVLQLIFPKKTGWTILKNMSSSMGRIIPYIMENKKCSKPPTRKSVDCYVWLLEAMLANITSILQLWMSPRKCPLEFAGKWIPIFWENVHRNWIWICETQVTKLTLR